MTLDVAIIAGVLAVATILARVIEKLIDKRNGGKPGECVDVDPALKRAIYDTERNSEAQHELMKRIVGIQADMKETLAIMRDRECPFGRNTRGG